MDHETPDIIEAQMAETRQSLTDKVAALEDTVVGTVQSATTAVNETVQSVKNAVGDTVEAVKDNVTNALNVGRHVRANPWAALGTAAVAGFVTGLMVFRQKSESTPAPTIRLSEPTVLPRTIVPPVLANQAPGVFDALLSRAGDELKKLGEIVIEKVSSELHRAVDDGIPRVVDKLTFASIHSPDGEPFRKAS